MGKKLILLVMVVAAIALWLNRPLQAPLAGELSALVAAPTGFDPAVSIDREPLQTELAEQKILHAGDYRFDLRAEFQLEAKVLGRRDYRRDSSAYLSPIDLALGWGAMARPEIIQQVDISQRGRFYYWRVEAYPIPRNEIIRSSANMHMIPASPEVLDVLKQTRTGDRVRLRGYLVNVDRDDGWRWRTSMVRTDTGSGACEVILVTLAELD